MQEMPSAPPVWTYIVNDGRVFCPHLSVDVDVSDCGACPYLNEPASTSARIVCLSPRGKRVAEMIDTLVWHA